MGDRCTSIRQEDLSEALKVAVNIEQQRIHNLAKSDVEAVAGGTLSQTNTIIFGSPTDPTGGTGTMGAVPTTGESTGSL